MASIPPPEHRAEARTGELPCQSFRFSTDTSSICVFDLGSLKHRVDDDADWWCWPPEEQVSEVNAGNVAIIDLGNDGEFVVHLQFSRLPHPQIEVQLSCPTGRVFVGAAEEITSEGQEPDCTRGGGFISIATGAFSLQVDRGTTAGKLCLALTAQGKTAGNNFMRPLRLA